MKKEIRKIFVNYEKEEKWINEMAAGGLNLIHYSFSRYLFEEGTPGEYIFRMELLKNMPSDPENSAYIKFMEDTGAECVTTYNSWVYFRKKASEGTFDIYSDSESRIKHYKKVAIPVGIFGVLQFVYGIYDFFNGLVKGKQTGVYFHTLTWVTNFVLAIIFIPTFFYYLKRIRSLKKEKQLYE